MAKKRAFVKYTKKGKIIPGSLIVTTSGGHPVDGVYKEVPYDVCCDGGGGTTRLVGTFNPSSNFFSIQYIGNNNTFTSNGYVGTTAEEWLIYFNLHFGWMGVFSSNPENPEVSVFFDINTEIFNSLGNPVDFQFFYIGAA